jgi:hypothetical protein
MNYIKVLQAWMMYVIMLLLSLHQDNKMFALTMIRCITKMMNNAKIACLLDVKLTKLFCARHIYLLAMSIYKISII